MPKVELHVHLEGSMRPETLLRLARRHRVSLPADTVEGLREWFRFRDFPHFVEIYLACSKALRDPEDFYAVARDFAAEQARQNVLYSEAHFTIGTHLMAGLSGVELRDALWEASRDAERADGVVVRWIPDIVRNVAYKWADKTLEWALDGRRHGVVALGLSGFEATHPSEPFREHFAVAAAEGLHRVAHAGETAGPHVVRTVVDDLGAERVGHGVRSLEDPALVEDLVARGVPLEVCPSSNVCLGVVPDLTSHPFPRLVEAGLVVTVNSDDPPLFATTLTDEYRRLAEAFGYGAGELAAFSETALAAAFVAGDERTALERRFAAEMDRAAAAHVDEPLTTDRRRASIS